VDGAGLTQWTGERPYYRRNSNFPQDPERGENGKRGITLLWAVGLLLLRRMTGWRASKRREPPTGGSLGRVEFQWSCNRNTQSFTAVAWLFEFVHDEESAKHSAMPRQEIAVASWRIGPWR